MSFEWQTYQLDELCDFTNGFAFKSTDYVTKGIDTLEVFRMGYISRGGGYKEDATPVFVPKKYGKDLTKYLLKAGDVVIAMTDMKDKVAILGNTAQIRHENRFVLNQRVGCIRVKRSDLLCPNFLYFYSNSAHHITNLRSRANSGVQVNLSTAAIKESVLRIPPIAEQRVISGLLMALDDRINLLSENNSTLEAIAQALFKSWFVDFDPVRAKLEGRLPEGIDEASSSVFPDSFEETELGQIPTGWEVKAIGDVVEAIGGGTPDTKNSDYWEPPIHNWTTPKDLSALTAPVLLRTERMLSDAGLRKVSSGLLPKGTLLMSSRAPIGYLAISQTPIAVNQGYIAIPPNGKLSPLFMLFWCKANMETIEGRANGSTFMEISKKAFKPILTSIPSSEVLALFETIAESLFSKIVENEKQIQTLTTLRDTLLPRLISGQLHIVDAEAELEKATA